MTSAHPRLAAAILAGGRARRLGGVCKALMLIDGVRIIDRQLAALRQVADPLFVVADDPRPFAGLELDVIRDVMPERGALGGIYTAIVASPTDRTLVVACDMPFLNARLLERLTRSRADLAIPRSTRGYEPLCAVYSRACAEPIRERLEAGSLEASTLPKGVHVEEIGPDVLAEYDPDGLMFVNVNTPHDYERAQGRKEWVVEPPRNRITNEQSGG